MYAGTEHAPPSTSPPAAKGASVWWISCGQTVPQCAIPAAAGAQAAKVLGLQFHLADANLNQIVRKLSGWAAIIAVPTAVTGFYGQNVPYPGSGTMWGFVVSTVVTVVLAIGVYVIFKKKSWL